MKAFVLIIIVMFISGCENSVGPNFLNTHIEGIVTDRETGSPLDHASIYLFRKETGFDGHNFWSKQIILERVPADEDGIFRIYYIISDQERYYLGAERDGYSSTGIYTAPRVKFARAQKINIQLGKKY